MFMTPYTTHIHTSHDEALRKANEAKSFAFWQTLQRSHDRFGAFMGLFGGGPAPVPKTRWFPAE